MMVGYGIAAWPFLAAKYGLHQRWRALTALIGVAALLAAALLAPSGARAATLARPSDARSGSLILKTEGEGYIDAARLGIDVDVTVSGPTLRARVTQVFRNTTNDWVEAIYVYPLPDGGAVDTLKMVIGDRVVVGDIKERQQARVIYEQAKQNEKAALTEQERPNIFTEPEYINGLKYWNDQELATRADEARGRGARRIPTNVGARSKKIIECQSQGNGVDPIQSTEQRKAENAALYPEAEGAGR